MDRGIELPGHFYGTAGTRGQNQRSNARKGHPASASVPPYAQFARYVGSILCFSKQGSVSVVSCTFLWTPAVEEGRSEIGTGEARGEVGGRTTLTKIPTPTPIIAQSHGNNVTRMPTWEFTRVL